MILTFEKDSFEIIKTPSHPIYEYKPQINRLEEFSPIIYMDNSGQTKSERLELLNSIPKISSKSLKRASIQLLINYRLNYYLLQNIHKIDETIENFDRQFKTRESSKLEPHEIRTVNDMNNEGIFLPISSLNNDKIVADGFYVTNDNWFVTELKSRRNGLNTGPALVDSIVEKIAKIVDKISAQINSTKGNLPVPLTNTLGVIDVYTEPGRLTPLDFVAGIDYTYQLESSRFPINIRALDVSCRGENPQSKVLFEVRCNPKPYNHSASPRIFTCPKHLEL
jgi:hypothetical protein